MARMNGRRGLLAPALSAVLLCTSCIRAVEEIEGNGLIETGGPVPEFTVTDGGGGTVTHLSFAQGQGLLVFFDLGCPDCTRELPRVDRYRRRNPGTRVLAIGRGHTAGEIAAHWRTEGLGTDYAPDPDGSVYSVFADRGVPLLVFTSDGTVERIQRTVR